MIMRAIEASEAQARLSQLLDDVEQGETIVITNDGLAQIANRLAPQ